VTPQKNDALVDVIQTRAALRQQTADLGAGGWLSQLYPALKAGTRELMRGPAGRARARELFVAVAALAALVVESIDASANGNRHRRDEEAPAA
jgi:hypothetical protein